MLLGDLLLELFKRRTELRLIGVRYERFLVYFDCFPRIAKWRVNLSEKVPRLVIVRRKFRRTLRREDCVGRP